MKNILSSLNESEKRRILEMHYKASNRQYLTEKPATQKTTTTTKAAEYNKKADEAITNFSRSDYFDMGELAATGASTYLDPTLQITIKNSASFNFVKIGTESNHLYSCKTGWGKDNGSNPFEKIKLEYKPNNYAGESTIDKGRTPYEIAETFVTKFCSYVGFPPVGSAGGSTQKTTTTPVSKPESELRLTSKDNYGSCPNTGYLTFDYDEKSTKDDVRVVLSRNKSYKDLYETQGNVSLLTYSCKTQKFYSWGDERPGNPWEDNVILKPSAKAAGYPQVQSDKGKTPRKISEEIISCMCNSATWE